MDQATIFQPFFATMPYIAPLTLFPSDILYVIAAGSLWFMVLRAVIAALFPYHS